MSTSPELDSENRRLESRRSGAFCEGRENRVPSAQLRFSRYRCESVFISAFTIREIREMD